MSATEFESSPLTPEQEAEAAKAGRIFINTMVKIARETLPNGSAPERMQLITTMAVQTSTTGAALAFDDAASQGLDADLYEAMILGLASAVGMKLGVVDSVTREFAMRVFWDGLHGGIAHAEQAVAAKAPKSDSGIITQ